MEDNLTIELCYQNLPSAQDDESAAFRLIAKLFAEKILETTKLDLGIPIEDEIPDGETEIKNN